MLPLLKSTYCLEHTGVINPSIQFINAKKVQFINARKDTYYGNDYCSKYCLKRLRFKTNAEGRERRTDCPKYCLKRLSFKTGRERTDCPKHCLKRLSFQTAVEGRDRKDCNKEWKEKNSRFVHQKARGKYQCHMAASCTYKPNHHLAGVDDSDTKKSLSLKENYWRIFSKSPENGSLAGKEQDLVAAAQERRQKSGIR